MPISVFPLKLPCLPESFTDPVFCCCVQDNRFEADEDGAALVDLLYTKIVDLRSKKTEFLV
jgi:hypothetical protein